MTLAQRIAKAKRTKRFLSWIGWSGSKQVGHMIDIRENAHEMFHDHPNVLEATLTALDEMDQ